MTISVRGLTIQPGKLLFGNENGLLTVPFHVPDRACAETKVIQGRSRRPLGDCTVRCTVVKA